jgi:hypothetical protein
MILKIILTNGDINIHQKCYVSAIIIFFELR